MVSNRQEYSERNSALLNISEDAARNLASHTVTSWTLELVTFSADRASLTVIPTYLDAYSLPVLRTYLSTDALLVPLKQPGSPSDLPVCPTIVPSAPGSSVAREANAPGDCTGRQISFEIAVITVHHGTN